MIAIVLLECALLILSPLLLILMFLNASVLCLRGPSTANRSMAEPSCTPTASVLFTIRILSLSDSKYLGINFDTGNTFIAGRDPVEFLKAFADRVTHVHYKDAHPSLAAAKRGELHGIASSAIAVGEGVNSENIKRCITPLKNRGWDGVFSIETEGEQNVIKSYNWLKSII